MERGTLQTRYPTIKRDPLPTPPPGDALITFVGYSPGNLHQYLGRERYM